VGEGGEIERSEIEPDEGFVSADRNPSSGTDCVRATFSHKGRREEALLSQGRRQKEYFTWLA
jgi:hypothetical protein